MPYSRAIRKGDVIHVAGTTAVDENGTLIGKGDIGKQSAFIFQKIKNALEQLGGKMEDVVRTRVYIVQGADWQAAAEEHGKAFKGIEPTETLLMISGLVNPDMLVEIEAEAIVG